MSKKISILILVIALLIPNTSLAANANMLQGIERDTDLIFFMDAFKNIKETYPFEIEDKDLIEGALKGMYQALDAYSDYYTPEEADELYQELSGSFSGIGVYIEEKDSYINIKGTIKDSPGEKAGLKKDDLIISVDDKDIEGMSIQDAQKLIKGEEGSKVKLGIKRTNKTLPIYIEVIRQEIVINPVEYKILEKNIGYIKLAEFTESSAKELKKALAEFDKKNVSKVILDLRDNPGGLLSQSIEISRQFVPSGPIVHIQEKNQDLVTHISTNKNLKYKLAVLVNGNSASASEIVAGAIKDTKAGTIIGTKTFGKGIVQSMVPLENGSLVKITSAEYLTPNKTSIHGKGIEPNIKVENTITTNGRDNQLEAAIKHLR